MIIEEVTNLEYRLKEILRDSISELNIKENYFLEEYLGGLLVTFLTLPTKEDLIKKGTFTKYHITLEDLEGIYTIEHLEAINNNDSFLLAKLGDITLFMTGFFPERLTRKNMSLGYYIDLGKAAYINAGNNQKEKALADIYINLAHRFTDYRNVLEHIDKKSMVERYNKENLTPNEIVQLLDLWYYSGNKLALKRLNKLGITPVNDNSQILN